MDKNWERSGRLKPEEKVLAAIDMTDGCVQICAEGIKNQRPNISERELLAKLRERIKWSKDHW